MPALDHAFKEIAQHAGRALARIAGLKYEGWSPVESTLQATTERLADRAFRTKVEGTECVVHMEFITEWNPDDLWSIQTKAALLSEKQRLPTRCLLFILQKKGFVSQNGTWQLRTGLRATQQLWFDEIPLWELKPEEWWNSEAYLMPIYPLVNHPESEREAILHASKAIEENATGPMQVSKLLTLLVVFGKLAFPKLGVPEMVDNFYEQFPIYRKLMEADGEIPAQRRFILKTLSTRFPDEDLSAVTAQVERLLDRERLEALIDTALSCKTFAEFAKQLKPKRKKKT